MSCQPGFAMSYAFGTSERPPPLGGSRQKVKWDLLPVARAERGAIFCRSEGRWRDRSCRRLQLHQPIPQSPTPPIPLYFCIALELITPPAPKQKLSMIIFPAPGQRLRAPEGEPNENIFHVVPSERDRSSHLKGVPYLIFILARA